MRQQMTQQQFEAIAELINGTRAAQGWGAMPPDEIYPVAEVWFRALHLGGIAPSDYPELLSRAIDHRIQEIRDKKRPTPFSIELLLACAPRTPENFSPCRDRNAEMEARGFPAIPTASEASH